MSNSKNHMYDQPRLINNQPKVIRDNVGVFKQEIINQIKDSYSEKIQNYCDIITIVKLTENEPNEKINETYKRLIERFEECNKRHDFVINKLFGML